MPTIDELLKQRYGQDRFNPGAGQTQMSFQEWMDRHPSLQGGAANYGKYAQATGAEGGAAYNSAPGVTRGPVQVAPADKVNLMGEATPEGADVTGEFTGYQPPTKTVSDPGFEGSDIIKAMGGPDPVNLGHGKKLGMSQEGGTPKGTAYKDFLAKRGVNARKSSAANAAGWRRMQATGKKKPASKSTAGNTQQAH